MKLPARLLVAGISIAAVLAGVLLAATPAHGQTIPDLRCWQGQYYTCWGAYSYGFPQYPVWNAQEGDIPYPPPTQLAGPLDWNPAFPTRDTMVWGQVKGDSLHRWAWVIVDSANLSSYERGPSVGGAWGELAATQDGIHPTPVMPGYHA